MGTDNCKLTNAIPDPGYPHADPHAGTNADDAITAAKFQPAATFWYLMVSSPAGTCGAWQLQKFDNPTTVNDPEDNNPYVYGGRTSTNRGANVDHVCKFLPFYFLFIDRLQNGLMVFLQSIM